MKKVIRRFRNLIATTDLEIRYLLGSRSARWQCEFNRLRKFGNVEVISKLLGPPLRVSHPQSFEYMFREIFEREIYRFTTQAACPRIIDCGANIGLASIYLGLRHPNARITAFEADPAIASVARANVDSFGLENVEIVAAAVTDHDGSVAFTTTGDLAGRIAAKNDSSSLAQFIVPAIRLEPYLQGEIEFLKIDIEGAEFETLFSVRGQLRNVKRLFVEYHGFAAETQNLPEFLALLTESGFRYYITNACDFRRHPLDNQTEHLGMDLQLNIFCSRIPL